MNEIPATLIDMKSIGYYKASYVTGPLYSQKTGFAPDEDIKCDIGEFRIDGWLIIYSDYNSDGATGAVDTKTITRAFFVHDFLYQLMRMGLLPRSFRKKADKEFYRICKEDGTFWFRAKYMLYVIRKVAKSATLAKNRKKLLHAP